MEFEGSTAYDQADFLADYFKRRNREESPNNAIERPILFELLEEVKGKHVLDLGCGDASFGRELIEAGAAHYTGVEGSEAMALLAVKNLESTQTRIPADTMETYLFPEEKFDVVTSRFAIHYVADIEELFAKVHGALRAQGKFLFSVQHPLTTASFESKKIRRKKRELDCRRLFYPRRTERTVDR